MRFYDREKETAELLRIRQLTMTDSSRMTLVTGRRRIGKTTLIQRAYADAAMVYLYVKRRNEKELVQSFCEAIRSQIDIFIPNGIAQFTDLLRLLLEYSKQHPFTLVLDEFQEFVHVNTDIFQDMQELWDTYHTQTHLNLIRRGYLPARKKKHPANPMTCRVRDVIIFLLILYSINLSRTLASGAFSCSSSVFS